MLLWLELVLTIAALFALTMLEYYSVGSSGSEDDDNTDDEVSEFTWLEALRLNFFSLCKP